MENCKTWPGKFKPPKSTVHPVETWVIPIERNFLDKTPPFGSQRPANFQGLFLGTRDNLNSSAHSYPPIQLGSGSQRCAKKGCILASSFILHSPCLLLLLEWCMPLPPASGGLIWCNVWTDSLFCFPLASPNNFASLFCMLAMNVIEMPIST